MSVKKELLQQIEAIKKKNKFELITPELETLYDGGVLNMNHKSCEMLADDLAGYIQDKYPDRELTIEVSEDGENGAKNDYPVDQVKKFNQVH